MHDMGPQSVAGWLLQNQKKNIKKYNSWNFLKAVGGGYIPKESEFFSGILDLEEYSASF